MDTGTQEATAGDDDVHWICVQPQQQWHDDLTIEGSRRALLALADALILAAETGSSRMPEAFPRDGEGYEIWVRRVDGPSSMSSPHYCLDHMD